MDYVLPITSIILSLAVLAFTIRVDARTRRDRREELERRATRLSIPASNPVDRFRTENNCTCALAAASNGDLRIAEYRPSCPTHAALANLTSGTPPREPGSDTKWGYTIGDPAPTVDSIRRELDRLHENGHFTPDRLDLTTAQWESIRASVGIEIPASSLYKDKALFGIPVRLTDAAWPQTPEERNRFEQERDAAYKELRKQFATRAPECRCIPITVDWAPWAPDDKPIGHAAVDNCPVHTLTENPGQEGPR